MPINLAAQQNCYFGNRERKGNKKNFVTFLLPVTLLCLFSFFILLTETVASAAVKGVPPPLEAPGSFWPGGDLELDSFLMRPTLDELRLRLMAEKNAPEAADPLVLRNRARANQNPSKNNNNNNNISNNQAAPDNRADNWTLVNALARHPSLLPWRGPRDMPRGYLRLHSRDIEWLDLLKLQAALGQPSVRPLIKKSSWNQALAEAPTRTLLEEHFGAQWPLLAAQIQRAIEGSSAHPKTYEEGLGRDLIPPSALLPPAMATRWGHYAPTRGLNCFATALGFFDFDVVFDKAINSVREPGHDLGMINHDEFLQALWLGYQELSEGDILAGLKWGDIVVFFDEADGAGFVSLKHAAVHIAGQIYFHKASKSSSSPIEFTTWNRLIEVWQKHTQSLNYRVFRKVPVGRRPYQKPAVAIEKILWSSK